MIVVKMVNFIGNLKLLFNLEYDRAASDALNNAPTSSIPARNPQWIPRNIVGNAVHDQKINCVVCLEIVERGQPYAFCGNPHTPHLFHSKCLYSWLKTANTCPTCRIILNFDKPPTWWYVYKNIWDKCKKNNLGKKFHQLQLNNIL